LSAQVTTIIPTHQRPALLRRAIASVLNQTYSDVLVCVYDNASEDETEAVVAQLAQSDQRIRYYRHSQEISVVQNFLFGMQRVASDYFSFLSDDDVLFPNFYKDAIEQLEAVPDALCAAGSAIEFDEAGRVRYAPVALWPRAGRFDPPAGFFAMLSNRHPTWTAILFRRAALQKVGLLDPTISGPIDLDYELRLAARFPFVVFYQPSAGYVHHTNRVSAAEDSTVIGGFVQISDKLSADARINPSLRAAIPALLRRQMRLKLYEIAVKSIATGRYTQALDAATLLRARFSQPLTAWCIRMYSGAAGIAPPLRWAVVFLEAVRLRLRASRAKRRLRETAGVDASQYARFVLVGSSDYQ
jgi:glycosyltransferase involved in cell wall biosynthesis